MKIAIISSVPVLPPFGGNRAKILQFIGILEGMGHEVHFMLLPSRQMGDVDIDAHHARFGDRFHLLTRYPVTRRLYLLQRAIGKGMRAAIRLFDADQARFMPLDETYYGPFTKQLKALQDKHRFDVAVVQYVLFSRALEAFPDSVLKVIDTHDSQANRLRGAEEARGFRRANVILAIQDDEAAIFRNLIGAHGPHVAKLSHISDLSTVVPLNPCEGATFVGSDFEANLQSLNYFLDKVLPLILAKRPDFRLFIAGTICNRVVDRPGVVRLGLVPSIADAFRQGPISINPTTAGTGVKIKLLESMALGVPVVTTAYGVKGVAEEYTNGAIQIPDGNAPAFADAVVEILSNDIKRNELGALARQSAEKWNRTQIANLVQVLEMKAG